MSEYWIGKNAEGTDRGTVGDTIPELYGYSDQTHESPYSDYSVSGMNFERRTFTE
jgi:hypothetical protein